MKSRLIFLLLLTLFSYNLTKANSFVHYLDTIGSDDDTLMLVIDLDPYSRMRFCEEVIVYYNDSVLFARVYSYRNAIDSTFELVEGQVNIVDDFCDMVSHGNIVSNWYLGHRSHVNYQIKYKGEIIECKSYNHYSLFYSLLNYTPDDCIQTQLE